MKRLFVGLGGMGCEIVKNITQLEVSTDDYFLFFDSDIFTIKEFSNLFEKNHVLRNNVYIFNLSNQIRKIKDLYDSKQINDNYFSDDTRHWIKASGSHLDGYSGVFRVFGRLGFELFAQNSALRETLQSFITANDIVTIIIVSSLCGNFGSGVILPLSSKIKSLIMDIGVKEGNIDVNIVGITEKIFYFISSIPEKRYMKANIYASVREIQDIINISNINFRISIPEIYDSRKNHSRHINQFLIIEPIVNKDVNSSISDISNLLICDAKEYIQRLDENKLKWVEVLSNDQYIEPYYDATGQVHIDDVWENEKRKKGYDQAPPITVFLSYSNTDNALADIIDNYINRYPNIKVSRFTRDVGYKGSFKEFMNSLCQHDYVITLISDNYLKSRACMYEVGELIKDSDYKNKIIFIVVGDDDEKYYADRTTKSNTARIYEPSGVIGYTLYWENEYNKLQTQLDSIKSESAKIETQQLLRNIRKIIDHDLGPFLAYLSDARGRTFDEMYQSGFADLINILMP